MKPTPNMPQRATPSKSQARVRLTTLVLVVLLATLLAKPVVHDDPFRAHATPVSGGVVPEAVAEPPHQQTQAERDRTVVRLRVTPAHITSPIGKRLQFAATAEDGEGRPVGGVAFTWGAERVNARVNVPISDDGQLTANARGTYRVVAEGAGQRAEAILEVVPAEAAAWAIPAGARAFGGYSGLRAPRQRTWDQTSLPAAKDPINRRGANPLDTATPAGFAGPAGPVDNSGAGSGNARFTLPLLNLPGRGIHLGLALTYNSLLWNRVGNEMVFVPELDDDWPAPGWTLGFGKVVGSMLIDADGDRHVLGDPREPIGDNEWRFSTDGSLIVCEYRTDQYGWRSVHCRYRDGSVIEFDSPGGSDVNYPTRLADADGNQVIIQYDDFIPGSFNWGAPYIKSIYDTLGRKITFHYQEGGYLPDRGALTAITGPGLNGGVRTLARFNWRTERFQPQFGGGLKVWPALFPAMRILSAVYYPDTGAGYWFRDPGSYSSYGMIASLNEQRDMYFSGAPLNEQGVIYNGRTVHKVSYNYPDPDPTRTEPPTYTQTTEVWENMTTAPAVTEYDVTRSGGLRRLEITHPDGRQQLQYEVNDQPTYDEMYTSTGAPLSKRKMTWENGEPWWSGYPTSPRLKRIETTDQHGQVAIVEYTYGSFSQVTDVREYDYDQTTVRRRTHMEYESAPEYRARHIFDLVSAVATYDGETGDPASWTQIKHDGQPLSPTPGIVQYDHTFNPEKPEYAPNTKFRGHVTGVTRYARAADRSEPVTQAFQYDLAGNLVGVLSGCCEPGTISYTSATQYAYPEETVRGAADPASIHRVVLKGTHDFNTGTPLSTTDADGATTLLDSSPETLRPIRVHSSDGGSTTFDYDDRFLTVSTTTRPALPATDVQVSTVWLDGRGMPIRQAQSAVGGWDVTAVRYDELGRPSALSNPVRRSGEPGTWAAPEHWHLIHRAPGRVTLMLGPDGSMRATLYGEVDRPRGASSEPGTTTRTVDAWGRWRWSRTDVLGRIVELVEPAPGGDGSLDGLGNLVTTYAYDAVGLVARIIQGGQERLFEHDSLGRLRRQALPEKGRTLNAAGELVGASGKWSDVFGYDDRSHLTSIVDARGVRTSYAYDDDPLGRLQRVGYFVPPGASSNEIMPAGASGFAYMPTGDVTRISSVTTDGVGVQTYEYPESPVRLASITTKLAEWPGHPLSVDAYYDSLGRLTTLFFPEQYGVRNDRRSLYQSYDSVGRPQTTSMATFPQRDMFDVASVLSYGPSGQVESSRAGPAGPTPLVETFAFDPVTGLPSGQRVTRGAERLLDLSYDFSQVVADPHVEPGRTGQLTAMADNLHPARGLRYSYDQVGRLRSVAQGTAAAPGWTQTYDYDQYGNRTAVHATAPTSGGPAVPLDGQAATPVDAKSNRLAIAGYQYDAAGNLIRSKESGKWLRYRYDAAGRLAAVLTDSGTTLESYVYGFDGTRLVTRHATGPVDRTIYVWAGGQVLSQYTRARARPGQPQGAPRWSRDNIYQRGRLVAAVEPSQSPGRPDRVRYVHPDRLGIRLVTGPGATDKAEQVNLPFGAAAVASSGFNPRYTSYDRSATTGLDYAVNRFYSPSHGRFTQPDPIGVDPTSAGNPQALNLYAYGSNDPVNTVDPSGLHSSGYDPELDCKYVAVEYEGVYYGLTCEQSTITICGSWDGACTGPPQHWEHERLTFVDGGAGSSGGGGGISVGQPASPRRMSLQEAIYRSLGGRGPFIPAPRPTTGLDAMAMGMLAAPVAAVTAVLTAEIMAGAWLAAGIKFGVAYPTITSVSVAAAGVIAGAAGVPSAPRLSPPTGMRMDWVWIRDGKIFKTGIEHSGPGGDLGHAEMKWLMEFGHLLKKGDFILLQGENMLCGKGYCNIALSETARTKGVDILYYAYSLHPKGALWFAEAFKGYVKR
jgi:RHS repeat-associated protein